MIRPSPRTPSLILLPRLLCCRSHASWPTFSLSVRFVSSVSVTAVPVSTAADSRRGARILSWPHASGDEPQRASPFVLPVSSSEPSRRVFIMACQGCLLRLRLWIGGSQARGGRERHGRTAALPARRRRARRLFELVFDCTNDQSSRWERCPRDSWGAETLVRLELGAPLAAAVAPCCFLSRSG